MSQEEVKHCKKRKAGYENMDRCYFLISINLDIGNCLVYKRSENSEILSFERLETECVASLNDK